MRGRKWCWKGKVVASSVGKRDGSEVVVGGGICKPVRTDHYVLLKGEGGVKVKSAQVKKWSYVREITDM